MKASKRRRYELHHCTKVVSSDNIFCHLKRQRESVKCFEFPIAIIGCGCGNCTCVPLALFVDRFAYIPPTWYSISPPAWRSRAATAVIFAAFKGKNPDLGANSGARRHVGAGGSRRDGAAMRLHSITVTRVSGVSYYCMYDLRITVTIFEENGGIGRGLAADFRTVSND